MALKTSPVGIGPAQSPPLTRYFALIGRRWLVILLCVLAGGGIAFLDVARTPKAYVATAQVFVTTSDVKDTSGLFSGNQFALSRVQTYVSIVTSPTVIDNVRDQLRLNLSERQLTQKITADAPLDKTLINIHVRDGSATRAAAIANSAATRFTFVVKFLETKKPATAAAPSTSVLRLAVIHPALAPTAPVAPQKRLILLVGFFGGLFVGLFLVLARAWTDNRLRSPRDVEAISSLPVLGVVPVDRRAKPNPNAFQFDKATPRNEAFRRLTTNLRFVNLAKPPKVIAVTSPLGREGKTAVALNLALGLSNGGLRVCLVEMDLRQPVLAQWLGLDAGTGLTSVLGARRRIEDAVQRHPSNLSVVTAGGTPPNPSELLGSEHLPGLVAALAERFDYVILDAASILLPIADGVDVVTLADATVLVVRAGKTTRENFRRSLNAITQLGATIAGVVVNRSDVEPLARARRGGARAPQPAGHSRQKRAAAEPEPAAAAPDRTRQSTGRDHRNGVEAAAVPAAVLSDGDRVGDERGRDDAEWGRDPSLLED